MIQLIELNSLPTGKDWDLLSHLSQQRIALLTTKSLIDKEKKANMG